LCEQYRHVQWKKIAGLRNLLAHEYFGLDDEIIWDIIKNHIPTLLESVNEILA